MGKLRGKAKADARKSKRAQSSRRLEQRNANLINEIRTYDDPVLFEVCDEVVVGSSIEEVTATFDRMQKILHVTENGVGLAAPQIGVTKRMIIIKSDSDSNDYVRMINPKIVSTSEKKKLGREMCLSYPGISAWVERFTAVTVSYLDEKWGEHTVEYKENNILSIIVQHEIDHIFGICKVGDWWKDPEGKLKEFQDKLEAESKADMEELANDGSII
jgi:peptide deformylase